MKLLAIFWILFSSQFLFGQNLELNSFEEKADQFLSTYVIDGYVDYDAIKTSENGLNELVAIIAEFNMSDLNESESQSFFINVYNLLVIDQIIKNYPTVSVKEIPGFFDRTKYSVGGRKLSLNEIEKDVLLKKYKDSRFHFVLVCGAKDCPKLWNHSFTSANLKEQLVSRTKEVLNDPEFLKVSGDALEMSEIFKWNRFEFGGRDEIIEFINSYREVPFDSNIKTSYYSYDWTLNDVKYISSSNFNSANNSFRYITSAAIPKGGIEIKIFNNLYSQIRNATPSSVTRSTYFTTSASYLYGMSNRLNIGFAMRYRRVANSFGMTSALDVFQSLERSGRHGLTAFGPQIRWAPVKNWTNFSIQSSLTFPIGENLSGGSGADFLDWSGPVFWTQFFNDRPIGDEFSLFTEIDFLIEEIGGSGKANRVSTPMTGIISWFPSKNFTIYGLLSFSPYLVQPFDYFRQYGMGMKYQFSPNFEFELLYTDFSNEFLSSSYAGQASTYNIGFRYSR